MTLRSPFTSAKPGPVRSLHPRPDGGHPVVCRWRIGAVERLDAERFAVEHIVRELSVIDRRPDPPENASIPLVAEIRYGSGSPALVS